MQEDVSQQYGIRDLADMADGFPGQPAQLSRYAVPDRIRHLSNSEWLPAFALLESALSRSRLN